MSESPQRGPPRRVCIVEEAEPLPHKAPPSGQNACVEDDDAAAESSCLRRDSDAADASVLSDNYLTMSGTIQRGRKKGQNVDVILNMSREELEGLEAALVGRTEGGCRAGAGPHVLLISLLAAPFAAVASALYSFFIGTLAWYNIFSFFSEEMSVAWRILVVPLLVLFYPFLIVGLSAGVGLVSAAWQVSWHWAEWLKEIADLEKGFFGWLCNALRLPDCAPYEVVVLSGMHTTPA